MKTTKILAILVLLVISTRIEAFDILDTISPSITQDPVEVIIWVKEGVASDDETRVLAKIQEGLDMWESVPTSRLAFDIVQVVHSATEPSRQPHQLMIIVGNLADLTSGGASFPYGGNPGTWYGVVADSPTMQVRKVTAHEVGHAIGFHHSTISKAFSPGNYPIMHWAVAGMADQLTPDDIAAVSIAYPNPTQPLESITGTIQGKLVIQGTTIPVSGVNVVAVNKSTGVPVVARLTGPRVRSFISVPDGVFELAGLPPGTYEVHYLDGHSYQGFILGISIPSDNIISQGLRMGFQADNFTPFSSSEITVNAGQIVDLGNIGITLEPMIFDGMHIGELTTSSTYNTPPGEVLLNAKVNRAYKIWLHIAGGLRDITAHSSGIPAGLTGSISGDPRGYISGIHGKHFFLINGTPTVPGHKTIGINLIDTQGSSRNFAFNLSVEPIPPDGIVARYHFRGNTRDSSGNGHNATNFGAKYVTDRNGLPNGALSFDGINDYLKIPNEDAFDLPEFTIVAVLRLPKLRSEDDWIISKGSHFGNFTLRRRSSQPWKGYASYVHQTISGNWSSLSSGEALPVNRFFYLAVSVSHSTFKAYVNGQLVQQAGNPPVPRYNDSPVLVGVGGYYGRTNYFKGVIDELVIYRGALNENAINRLITQN